MEGKVHKLSIIIFKLIVHRSCRSRSKSRRKVMVSRERFLMISCRPNWDHFANTMSDADHVDDDDSLSVSRLNWCWGNGQWFVPDGVLELIVINYMCLQHISWLAQVLLYEICIFTWSRLSSSSIPQSYIHRFSSVSIVPQLCTWAFTTLI